MGRRDNITGMTLSGHCRTNCSVGSTQCTSYLVAREVDAQLLCDRTGGGVTNDRHGPAIKTATASTRADILVMALMWPLGFNSLLQRVMGFHSRSCSSAHTAQQSAGVRGRSNILQRL